MNVAVFNTADLVYITNLLREIVYVLLTVHLDITAGRGPT